MDTMARMEEGMKTPKEQRAMQQHEVDYAGA